MIFVFDFDHTIFNASAFKKALSQSVRKFGISKKFWQETYKEIVEKSQEGYDYDVKEHSFLLGQGIGKDSRLLEKEMRRIVAQSHDFVYRDTEPFLRYFKSRKTTIVLLTLGNVAWQKEKIKGLKIKKYFDKFIFTARHKKYLKLNLADTPQSWVFINDNPREIKELMPLFSKSIFLRLKRRGGKKFLPEEEELNIPTFSNLSKLEKYIVENIGC